MKVVVAAMKHCGCHVGELVRVEKNQVQMALDGMKASASACRYIAFFADGVWDDPNNYISDKASWEDYFKRKLEQQ